MIGAEFADGTKLPAFDSELSDNENQALDAAVAREARRRLKEGLPYCGRLRVISQHWSLREFAAQKTA